ncbi:magnesium transporter MgtE N-terminal domain-containing protein [Mycolicibacterium vinylchloridicum]|uniref:magnesium transporter MgtE N-terminal domain-containing protein n=1 Tax=Mycolicibacterium vinylchloridicum TaxID=2736928 RepID=UPI0015CCA598|nr:magnesium transporter [Mycolicibacterium vinylchloridicum]
MLLLSRVIGHHVRDPGGQVVGRLTDLTVSLAQESGRHRVQRVLVQPRHGAALLVPWDRVTIFERGRVVLSTSTADTAAAMREYEILLGRDVLDTQVIDVVGQRLARVADVVLARTDGGGIELVGVDVGFGAVLRRLGLGGFAGRFGADVIAWTDVHLTSERGHVVQLGSPRAVVHHLDARELAGLVSRLDTESAADVLAAGGPAVAAAVVRAAHPVVGERVLRAMPRTDAARIVAAMPEEHAGRWRQRLEQVPALRGRRFLRSRVWPRRRHTGVVSS